MDFDAHVGADAGSSLAARFGCSDVVLADRSDATESAVLIAIRPDDDVDRPERTFVAVSVPIRPEHLAAASSAAVRETRTVLDAAGATTVSFLERTSDGNASCLYVAEIETGFKLGCTTVSGGRVETVSLQTRSPLDAAVTTLMTSIAGFGD